MKRYMGLLITLLLVLTASSALALTELEWNLRSGYKANGDISLYDAYFEESIASGSDIPEVSYRFESAGFLPAGSYVRLSGESLLDKVEIIYYRGGATYYAYVSQGSISSAMVSFTAANGEKFSISDACYNRPETWYMVLSEKYGDAKAQLAMEALQGGASSEKGDSGETKVTIIRSGVSWVDENGQEQSVKLDTLGTAVSVVVVNKEKITVPTSELRWETSAKENQMLAVIKAHKTGEASLRVKASSKSTCIKKIDTNRIVLVMEKGKKFTKVICDGMVGYIINTALTYYPVGGVKEGEPQPQPGWVSFRGKLNSRNTINIRQNGKNGSRILKDFKAGTPIMVFSQEGKWSEIDVGGYRAYILTEYVTLDDGTGTEE